MPDSLILSGVTKHYGDGHPVIHNLDFTFEAGVATGLVGPNGAGKTTLIRLLSLASYPTEGSITYRNRSIQDRPHVYLSHVGMVHDTAELPDYVSAVEWLEYVMRSRDAWKDQPDQALSTALDEVMLDERRDRLIGTYSSGMKKKTQIAAALVCNPEILLLDEPLRGLDVDAHAAVIILLNRYVAEGGLLIIASHMKDSLTALCGAYLQLAPVKKTNNPI